MNAKAIKSEVLAWLRFIRRYPIVATEAGPWNADVLGMNVRTVVEVEVKTSLSDLRAEFRHKGGKHFVYKDGTLATVPNQFWFAVPEELAEKASFFLQKGDTFEAPPMLQAGLLAVTGGGQVAGRNLEIVVQAQQLHDRPPKLAMVLRGLRRMGSELVQLRLDQNRLETRFDEFLARLEHDHQVETVRLDGGLDIEAPDAFAEARGRELALAVHPDLDWTALGAETRTEWTRAATRLWDQQNLDLGVWARALGRC